MPHIPAVISKALSPLPYRLGPLLLALLMGCTGSSQGLRVETEQHTPIVHVPQGAHAPVHLGKDARAVEQALTEIHGLQKDGGTLLNRINSIARSNPKYAAMLKRGMELLESIGYLDGRP